MTTASKEKARIDKFLRLYGSGIGTLTRIVGTTNQSTYSVDVRAHVRKYLPNELTDLIIQGDSLVIISASEIIAAQWPGAQIISPTPGNDPRVSRRGDKFTFIERVTNVEAAEPFYFDSELVRIHLQVRGT